MKLPKKEDLLPKAQPPIATTQSKSMYEGTDVERAKANAEIATQRDKQVEHEINTKLREQGYKSLEDALADAKRKMEEANQLLEVAKQQEQSINGQLEEIEQQKQKVINAFAIVKDREDKSNARLEAAIKIEKGRQEQTAKSEILRQEVQAVIDYHNVKIVPCVKALRKSVKTIYSLWTVLENPKEYDQETLSEYITSGLNFVGKLTTTIDKYLDNVKGTEVRMPYAPKDKADTAS